MTKSDKAKKHINKKALAIALIAVFLAFIVIGSVFLGLYLYVEPSEEPMRNLGYIMAQTLEQENWREIDFSAYTHVIYAFANVTKDRLLPTLTDIEAQNLHLLAEHLRTNCPEVKFILSVAGDSFCPATDTAQKRSAFVDELQTLDGEYGFDGFDIDWEYPEFDNGRPHCRHCSEDHLALVELMRSRFEDKSISCAVSGSVVLLNKLHNRRLAKVVDFVNVMTYDLGKLNHCAYNAVASAMFNAYLAGYSKRQLNLGLAYYGRYNIGNEVVYYDYCTYMHLVRSGQLKIVERNGYSYAKIDGHRLSLDSENQILKKVDLAFKRGYGGVFCWHIGCDENNTLTHKVATRIAQNGAK